MYIIIFNLTVIGAINWVEKSLIHLHILYIAYSAGSLKNIESIPKDLGNKADYTVDRMPVYRGTQIHIHFYSHITDNLEVLISLQCMSLD